MFVELTNNNNWIWTRYFKKQTLRFYIFSEIVDATWCKANKLVTRWLSNSTTKKKKKRNSNIPRVCSFISLRNILFTKRRKFGHPVRIDSFQRNVKLPITLNFNLKRGRPCRLPINTKQSSYIQFTIFFHLKADQRVNVIAILIYKYNYLLIYSSF